MTDNLEIILTILFKKVSSMMILNNKICPENFPKPDFIHLFRNYYNVYSDTELENLYHYITSNFYERFYFAEERLYDDGKLNVFSVLKYYTDLVLLEQNDEVLCKYSEMLHWRNISLQLSEDLLITSYLAHKDISNIQQRWDFNWKLVISHNNVELRKLLAQGICENHYHLNGSAPIFQLNWLNLMNDLKNESIQKRFWEIEKSRRNSNIKYSSSYTEITIRDQVCQASAIRIFLFLVITGKGNNKELETLYDIIQNINSGVVLTGKYIVEISKYISKIKYEVTYGFIPDYALVGVDGNYCKENRTLMYAGERWLLYSIFKAIYSREKKILNYQHLFYAYLVIKENIRSELVQLNPSVGFENFRIYQDRKEYFLGDNFYSKALTREAIRCSLFESNVLTVEARIAPKQDAFQLLNKIKNLDADIDMKKEFRERFFYVIHFVKTGMERFSDSKFYFGVNHRHQKLRHNIKLQATAISILREKNVQYAKRIRGIDAANTEIGCGPEVFAQAFRFLKDHHRMSVKEFKQEELPQLGLSYHVGEDFLNLTSGLRAIDEAIVYLNLNCGDRLGHALALGVDVEDWYASKNNRILLPQQDYLDDIVWMHETLRRYHIGNESYIIEFLRKEYDYYFQIIYRNAISENETKIMLQNAKEYYQGTVWEQYFSYHNFDFTMEKYYFSWLIRGDCPELYSHGYYSNEDILEIPRNTFNYYSINYEYPRKQNIRFFPEVGYLYYLYHYNFQVKKMGSKPIEVKIKPQYVKAVKIIQKFLQFHVAKKGISIETNPSSNYLIGTFKNYSKHPIINFYNQNLVYSKEKLEKCSQICVSINTDDQGVFSTSLENEYALMALALEKEKDAEGNYVYKKQMIYKWLDDIRKMGIRQTFLEPEEMKRIIHSITNDNYNY